MQTLILMERAFTEPGSFNRVGHLSSQQPSFTHYQSDIGSPFAVNADDRDGAADGTTDSLSMLISFVNVPQLTVTISLSLSLPTNFHSTGKVVI